MSNRAFVFRLPLFLLAAVVASLVGCAKKPRPVQQGPISALTIVATVDTVNVLLREVLDEYTSLTAPGQNIPATLEASLNEVIYRKCAYIGAEDFKDFDKNEIHRLARNRTHDAIIAYMLQELLPKRVTVSEAAIDSAYHANIAKFTTPERRRVTHILVSTNPKAWEVSGINVAGLTAEQLDAKAKAQIDEYYSEVKKGANLGDLAAKYTHDTNSKPKRGDTGLFQRGDMVNEFEKVAFGLRKGALSTPFKTPFGWHFLRVEEIIDSTTLPLDAALREDIRRQLRSFKETEVVSQFADSVYDAATIVWNEPLLNKDIDTYDPLDWVCIVNNTDTVEAGILRELELMYRTGGRRGAVTPEVRKQILSSRISPYALIAAARQLGYADSDTMKQVYRYGYRQEIVNRIYRDRTPILDKLPTDDELKRYYEEHKSDFVSDKPIKVQQIILKDAETAGDVKRQAEAGADFQELAKKYSPGEPDSKEAAFDLGWIAREDLGEKFFDAAWIMNIGEYAGPVQTRWGWHVIKVVDRKSMKNFEAARLDVQQMIRAQAFKDANDKWVESVTRGRDIVRFDDILSQIDLKKRDYYYQLADSLQGAKTAADTVHSGS